MTNTTTVATVPAKSKAARKAANVAAYQRRVLDLMMKQRDANRLRKQYGYRGSDDLVFKLHREAMDRKFIEESLSGPSSTQLCRWLKNRQFSYPTWKVVRLINRFFEERPMLKRVREAA